MDKTMRLKLFLRWVHLIIIFLSLDSQFSYANKSLCLTSGSLEIFSDNSSWYYQDGGSRFSYTFNNNKNEIIIVNMLSGDVTKLDNPFPSDDLELADSIVLSGDGEYLTKPLKSSDYTVLSEAKTLKQLLAAAKKMPLVEKYNIKTKKYSKSSILDDIEIKGVKGSVVGEKNNQFLLIKTKSGVVKEVPFKPNEESNNESLYTARSPNPKFPIIRLDKKNQMISVIKNGKTLTKFNNPDPNNTWLPNGYTADGKYYVRGSSIQNNYEFSNLDIVDLSNGKRSRLQIPGGYIGDHEINNTRGGEIHPKENKIILNSNSSGTKKQILDLETGKIKELNIKDSVYNLKFYGEDGKLCSSVYSEDLTKSNFNCYDEISGNIISSERLPFRNHSLTFKIENKYFFDIWAGNDGRPSQKVVFVPEKVCPKDIPIVDCNCSIPTVPLGKNNETIKDISLSLACSTEFVPEAWEAITPKGKTNLTESEALAWLKRFSKPNGFNTKEHLGVLVGLINGKMHEGYPSEMLAALAGISQKKTVVLLDSLFEKFPDLKHLKGKPNQTCLTSKEKLAINSSGMQHLEFNLQNLPRSNLDQFRPMLVLANASLDDKQKEVLAEKLADKLSEAASDSLEFHNVFQSKLYKFSINRIKSELGIKHNNITDLTTIRDGSRLKIKTLGLNDFPGGKLSEFGFYSMDVSAKEVTSIPPGKTIVEKYNWEYDKKNFVAEVKFSRENIDKEIVSTGNSPNYQDMWKKGKFSGVVIAGTNMGTQSSERVMQQYLAYYTENGFSFGEAKDKIDLIQYLKEKTSGDQPMHYFIKEAHSDGDEKNLFRVDKFGKILTGTKKVGQKIETVDLVFPSKDKEGSTLIANTQFGEWMKAREKNKGPELIYLNTSCWSRSKAIYEIPAAGTSKFINLPSDTLMNTFSNTSSNAMYGLVDGVRRNLDYKGIRQLMEKDESYKTRKKNVIIFPDEDEYKWKITDVLRVPISLDTKLFIESQGKKHPYSIEDPH